MARESAHFFATFAKSNLNLHNTPRSHKQYEAVLPLKAIENVIHSKGKCLHETVFILLKSVQNIITILFVFGRDERGDKKWIP